MPKNTKSVEKVNGFEADDPHFHEKMAGGWQSFLPPRFNTEGELLVVLDEMLKKGTNEIPAQYSAKVLWRRAYDWIEKRHFIVTLAGKPWVANEARDPESGSPLTFCTFEDFAKRYNNWHFLAIGIHPKGGTPTIQEFDPAKSWLKSAGRREVSDVILAPPGGPIKPDPYAYNLWRGFGVDDKKGKWDVLDEFLFKTICAGRQEHYDWLIRWMARCVQQPAAQGEVAVALKGDKGTGKGTLGKLMMRLFKHHCFHVTSPKHFTGNFNGHLMNTLFLFVDEAFWAGGKQQEGLLKAMITEPRLAFEQKYQPVVMMNNRLKMMIASNEDWMTPATRDERRFFALNVPSHRKGDTKYWTAVNKAIDDELPALFYHLKSLDLRDFDFRNPPHTDELNRQKVESLKGFMRYWFDCLAAGEVYGADGKGLGWAGNIRSEDLFGGYRRFEMQFPDSNNKIGDLLPDLGFTRKRASQPPRNWYYEMPELEAGRAAFLKYMNIDTWKWARASQSVPAANDNQDMGAPAIAGVVPASQMSQPPKDIRDVIGGNDEAQGLWAKASGQ